MTIGLVEETLISVLVKGVQEVGVRAEAAYALTVMEAGDVKNACGKITIKRILFWILLFLLYY